MATAAERLVEVQDAISAIVGGAQEYTVNGETVRKADLGDLQRLEAALRRQVAATAAPKGAGGFSVATFGSD